jgi:hypothetical protein
MLEKIITVLFENEGAPFRTRGIAFLALIGGFVFMGVTGVVSVEAYIAVTTGVGGIYIGVRSQQNRK